WASDVRQAARQRMGKRQPPRTDQEVIRETGAADRPDPIDDVVPQEPLGITLVVDLVTDADEPVASRPGPEACDRLSHAGCREIHPPDDASDERRHLSQAQEVARLVDARTCLHEDGRLDIRGFQFRLKVVRPEGTAYAREGVREPWIVGRR